MGTINTKGIVLMENNLGDYDKMITILTPGLGKIGCAAKGARRPKSLLMAGSQFLCFADYTLYKGNGTYNLNSCDTIEFFYNIRTDLDKYKYAVHITKIILDVTNENENCYRTLQLFLNTLYTISETDKNLDLTLSIFKLRLMCILGFRPNVEKCTNCGIDEDIKYFSLKDNGFKCSSCGKIDKSAIEIMPATADAIRFIASAPAKKIFSFNVPETTIKELEIISKLYLNEKLEKEYKLEELFK